MLEKLIDVNKGGTDVGNIKDELDKLFQEMAKHPAVPKDLQDGECFFKIIGTNEEVRGVMDMNFAEKVYMLLAADVQLLPSGTWKKLAELTLNVIHDTMQSAVILKQMEEKEYYGADLNFVEGMIAKLSEMRKRALASNDGLFDIQPISTSIQ